MSFRPTAHLDFSNVPGRISKILNTLITNPMKVLRDQHLYAAIGFVSLLPLVKAALSGLFDLIRAKSLNQIARLYKPSQNPGESSYVAVTGATAGIGKAYCETFARLGFNIVAISRDQSKLEGLESELLAINNTIKVKKVKIDFSKHFRKHDIQTLVVDQIKDLDISILVNNVGEGGCYAFNELNSSKIFSTIHVNIYPLIFLTQGLMPQLAERSKKLKTGIINVSSVMGTEVFLPYFSVYSATKAFGDYFSKALASEYPNISILSARLGRTKTDMNPTAKVTPEVQVKSTLRFLGVKSETLGNVKTYTEAHFGPSMYWMVKRFLRKSIYGTYERKYRTDLIQNGDLPLVFF